MAAPVAARLEREIAAMPLLDDVAEMAKLDPGRMLHFVHQLPEVAGPAYQQSLIEGGFEPTVDSNPEKFRQSLAADVALWAPVVKSLGLKLD